MVGVVRRRKGWSATDPPNVSAQENAGNPHYNPTREQHRPIRAGELVLIDLWGKLPSRGAVFADIAWVGFTGRDVPAAFATAFAAARAGRDAAIDLVESATRAGGRELRGYEVDRACRGGARAGRLRPAVHPSHRPQPRAARARRRRPHGRLRNPRRPSPDPRHRLYNRTRRLYRSVRRSHRNQHVRLRARGARDGPAPGGDRLIWPELSCGAGRRRLAQAGPRHQPMRVETHDVHAKDHPLLRRPHRRRLDRRRHGHRVPVGAAAGLVRPDDRGAADEQRAARRRD